MTLNVPDKHLAVIINNRNRLTSLKQLLNWVNTINNYPVKIIILDCKSTYEPLLSFYDELDKSGIIEVIRLDVNSGPPVIDQFSITGGLDYFIYTDADTIPKEDCPSDLFEHLIKLSVNHPNVHKIGISLEIEDVPNSFPLKEIVIKTESSNWRNLSAKKDSYLADIDTSLALYRKNFSSFFVKQGNLQTLRPYVARYSPWYLDPNNISKEYELCILHAGKYDTWYKFLKNKKVIKHTGTKNSNIFHAVNKKITSKQKSNENIKGSVHNMLIRKPVNHPVLSRIIGSKFFMKSAKKENTVIEFISDIECVAWKNIHGKISTNGYRIIIDWDLNKGKYALDFDSSCDKFRGISQKDGSIRGTLKEKGIVDYQKVPHHVPFVHKQDSGTTVIVGAYKVDLPVVRKFIKWNERVFERNKIHLVIVSDKLHTFSKSWIQCFVYPVEQQQFSLPRTINYGLKRITRDGIIIKSDIDIIFTDETIKYINSHVSKGQGLVCQCANISTSEDVPDAIKKWPLLLKNPNARGACFALTRKDWIGFHGYDERIFGWGGDDDEMWWRASSKIKMASSSQTPLFHIHHPIRTTKGNSTYYPRRSDQNMSVCKNFDWKSPTWGVPKGSPKKVTFCMPVKARSKVAMESIKSIVSSDIYQYFDFIICEDVSNDMIDLSNFEFKELIQHYVVNTNQTWNKSLLLNFAISKANSDLVNVWDSDFIFDKNFSDVYLRAIDQTDWRKKYLRVVTTETDTCIRNGVKFNKGSMYGGFYTFSKNHFTSVNGFDENFSGWGYEDLDFNSRISRRFGLREEVLSKQNLIFHKSHSDNLRDISTYNRNKLRFEKNKKYPNRVNQRIKIGNVMQISKTNPKTIVIMGNGPSLKKEMFDKFKGIDTIGMNGAYRYYYRTNWWPKYFACFDYIVTDCHQEAYKKMIEDPNVPIERYFLLKNISNSEKLTYIQFNGPMYTYGKNFISDFRDAGCTGANCCQIASILGYKKLILIGIDCNYVDLVDGAKKQGSFLVMDKTPEKNPNYFIDDYQQKGDMYNVPNASKFHTRAFENFASFAKQNDIDVVNCSPISTLKCFRKSTLECEL